MPVVIRDPTPEDVARFLATRTGQQMLEIVRSLREPAAQAAFTEEILRNPLPTPNPKRISMPQKAKKALNAFVGFRCKISSLNCLMNQVDIQQATILGSRSSRPGQ